MPFGMILRIVFCLALIAVLIPHEPDLGFGRPASALVPQSIETWFARASDGSTQPCEHRRTSCATSEPVLDGLQARVLEGLADVKADIDRDRKARAEARAQ
jgi:hypothetical protein